MESKCSLCTFHLGDCWFGIAVEKVLEVMPAPPVTPVPLAPRAVAGLVNRRGQIVPVIDIGCRLGFPKQPAAVSRALVVVRSDDTMLGLLVDGAGEVVEAPEEAFEAAPANLPAESRDLVTRVCKLPGHLLHVLDVDRATGVEVAASLWQ